MPNTKIASSICSSGRFSRVSERPGPSTRGSHRDCVRRLRLCIHLSRWSDRLSFKGRTTWKRSLEGRIDAAIPIKVDGRLAGVQACWLTILIAFACVLSGPHLTSAADSFDAIPLESLPSSKELPNVLVDADGNPIKSVDAWNAGRDRIKEMIQYYEYGHLPPRPNSVTTINREQKPYKIEGTIEEQLTLGIDSQKKVPMRVAIHWPAKSGRPVPAVIVNVDRITDLPYIEAYLKQGFAFIQYQRSDLDPDKNHVVGPAQQAYPDYDWATLAVWAWGGMRVVDFLESRPEVDLKKLIITGHSRGGKAALLAGALDERFAIVAPNGSGCGGAGCFRDSKIENETLEKITDPNRFSYWFHTRLRWFADREDRLPFDQHFVKALVAPRALLCTEARDDAWANPPGTKRTNTAAREVYALFGASEKIAVSYREGKHDQNEEDWSKLLEFAQWQFFGKEPKVKSLFWNNP